MPPIVRSSLAACILVASALCACAPRQAPARPAAAAAAVRTGTSERGLAYATSGRGEPLVLIHGFQTDHREWDEVVAALGPAYRVIRYDLRGHGRSAPAVTPFVAHEELAALLRELGVDRAHVVGLSAGATVALDLAIERPDLVRGLVLVSPGLPEIRVEASRAWMRPIGDAVRAGKPDSAAALWWASPIMAGTRARGDAGARYRDVVMANAGIWTQNPAAQQRPTPPPGTRLGTLRAPLLVVTGDRDETGARAQADSIVARAPHARHATIRGAGHMLSTERPAELVRLLDDFLRPSPEFAVARAVLAHYRLLPSPRDSPLVVADTPVVVPLYPDSGRGVLALAWLPGKLRGLAPATLADFRAAAGTQVPWWRDSLAARLGPRVRWESDPPLVAPRADEPTPPTPFPRTPPRARLSRVGFDPARRQALVYVEWVCGALCGQGMYVLLERRGADTWTVRREFAFWSS